MQESWKRWCAYLAEASLSNDGGKLEVVDGKVAAL